MQLVSVSEDRWRRLLGLGGGTHSHTDKTRTDKKCFDFKVPCFISQLIIFRIIADFLTWCSFWSCYSPTQIITVCIYVYIFVYSCRNNVLHCRCKIRSYSLTSSCSCNTSCNVKMFLNEAACMWTVKISGGALKVNQSFTVSTGGFWFILFRSCCVFIICVGFQLCVL